MGNASVELKALIRHWFRAGGPHQVHSPLVYRLLTEVLRKSRHEADFGELRTIRKRLLHDTTQLEVADYGAGSRKNYRGRSRKVAEIARFSLQSSRCAEAFSRIVRDLQPKTALELGTSLGLTTGYLARACSNCQWTTIEGAPQLAQFATNLFKELAISNVKVQHGNFDDVVPEYLKSIETIDFALIDGNHRYEPTWRYFNWLAEKADENSVFIFDDIHWSAEMERAWVDICKSDKTAVTIDFFHFGVVFFRSGIEKQNFVLRLP